MRIYDKSKGVKGVALNDVDRSTILPAYTAWLNMLRRCYDRSHYEKFPTYAGCSVCDEWLRFSNFQAWYNEHYRDGYELDKDIICKGNKVYGPEFCDFVPKKINYLLCKSKGKRGEFPIGVTYKKDKGQFKAYMLVNRKQVYLGYFNNPDEAFDAYKKAKEEHIKEVAKESFENGEISERIFNALMQYEVEITD